MKHRIRNTLVCWMIGAILFAPTLCVAETLLLADKSSGVYGALTSTISDAIARQGKAQRIHYLDSENSSWKNSLNVDDFSAVVTIGTGSMSWLARTNWDIDSLSLLTTKEQYLEHFDSGNTRHSVIYLNQPMERIIEVGREILGKETHFIIFDERRLAIERDMILGSWITYSPLTDGSIIQSIRQLKSQGNYAIVALPSHAAFTPITIKNTLISAYKSGIPIIGYSQSFTRAGALFSVHADLQSLDKEVATWLDEKRTPRHRSSLYYQVTVNAQIAKSLGFQLESPWDKGRINREAVQ